MDSIVLGAYDVDGEWWHADDIEASSNGLIWICFKCKKEEIVLVDKNTTTYINGLFKTP